MPLLQVLKKSAEEDKQAQGREEEYTAFWIQSAEQSFGKKLQVRIESQFTHQSLLWEITN